MRGCDDAGMRELNQLIDVEEPAWPELRETLGGGSVPVEVLPADTDVARTSLLQLQVTARSYLGAVVLHCGGLVVDNGWVRVFGSPLEGAVPSLAQVNQFPGAFDSAWQPDAGLVVAHDVLGGVFALNGGAPARAGRPGHPVRSSTSPRIRFAGRHSGPATRRGWPGWFPERSLSYIRICAGPDGRTRSGR